MTIDAIEKARAGSEGGMGRASHSRVNARRNRLRFAGAAFSLLLVPLLATSASSGCTIALTHATLRILTASLVLACTTNWALLVQAGLTPLQALQAATRNAARFMGREQDLGTIQPGKLADLVLLEANPLDDIANTRRINAVVFGGRLFRKSDLEDMLAIVEVSARN